jgi:hypothetical protein
LNKREEETKEKEAWRVVDGSSIVPTEHNPRQGTGNAYTYGKILFLDKIFRVYDNESVDHVFDYRTSTQDVYDKCAKEIISSALRGQNGNRFYSFSGFVLVSQMYSEQEQFLCMVRPAAAKRTQCKEHNWIRE